MQEGAGCRAVPTHVRCRHAFAHLLAEGEAGEGFSTIVFGTGRSCGWLWRGGILLWWFLLWLSASCSWAAPCISTCVVPKSRVTAWLAQAACWSQPLPTGEALKLFIHTNGPNDRIAPLSSYSVRSQSFSVAADSEHSNETSHVSSRVDNSGRKSCSAKTYVRLLRPPGYRKLGWCSLKNRLP